MKLKKDLVIGKKYNGIIYTENHNLYQGIDLRPFPITRKRIKVMESTLTFSEDMFDISLNMGDTVKIEMTSEYFKELLGKTGVILKEYKGRYIVYIDGLGYTFSKWSLRKI